MAEASPSIERIPGYCSLCISRCGSIATVQDGRFVALDPDPSHPTGRALCAKGRAAPELVYDPRRLRYPLRRTRPTGDPDPGWERIGWDEALDLVAGRLAAIAAEGGPESVVVSVASPSTSATDDTTTWISRFMNAFGTPNLLGSMELCGWGRFLAPTYTYGAPVPGAFMPDLERAGCILYWGYNPNIARISHATATADALKRGARLIVVDPRKAGAAAKADLWLQVRPGTDAALALGIAGVMIERGWFDREFVRDWTNGPLLVREDDGRLLTEADLDGGGRGGGPARFVAWDAAAGRPVVYNPATGRYAGDPSLLPGTVRVATVAGEVECRSAFEIVAAGCRQYPPDVVASICGVEAAQVVDAARMLWESRPVAYYAWSGVEQHTNATQIARAIGQLYALTGSLDAPGGNVLFTPVPAPNVEGRELLPPGQRARALGVLERPLGPAKWGFVTTDDVYRAILEGTPYRVRGLVGFGANVILAHADSRRGREALAALDFYVHADLFMNPTAELADVVLPVASPFEREALKVGFEGSQDAASFVQLRRKVVDPPGEARSDAEIVFGLATRLGLGDHFWGGDIDAGNRSRLQASGLTLDDLRAHPEGIRVPLETRFRKYADERDGVPVGFSTPTRKVELYSQTLLDHGYPPAPEFEEPRVSPISRPDLAERYPLILTSAKHHLFCETQHRGLPSLRRKAMDPELEIHPAAAEARGIGQGDWVVLETPSGSVRARARFNDSLRPDVVVGQHGWWEPCPEVGAPGYDPYGPDGANLNLVIANDVVDPISGSVPHRAYVAQVRAAGDGGGLGG